MNLKSFITYGPGSLALMSLSFVSFQDLRNDETTLYSGPGVTDHWIIWFPIWITSGCMLEYVSKCTRLRRQIRKRTF